MYEPNKFVVAFVSFVVLLISAVVAVLLFLYVCKIEDKITTHGSLYKRCCTACKGGINSAYLVDCAYSSRVGT